MQIYLIEQNVLNDYDTYDSMVVIANTEQEAIELSIKQCGYWGGDDLSKYEIQTVGIAFLDQEKGVLLNSFNAG